MPPKPNFKSSENDIKKEDCKCVSNPIKKTYVRVTCVITYG